MLTCLIFGNPRVWENLLPHIEFAYNRVVNSTTDVDQGEKIPEVQAQQTQAQSEAQAQPMITFSTMPRRITRSKAQGLGDKHQLVSLL